MIFTFFGKHFCNFSVMFCSFIVMSVSKMYDKCREAAKRRKTRNRLKRLPKITFDKSKMTYDTCVICLDDFEDGDELRMLPCNHVYHLDCIDPWLFQRSSNNFCYSTEKFITDL